MMKKMMPGYLRALMWLLLFIIRTSRKHTSSLVTGATVQCSFNARCTCDLSDIDGEDDSNATEFVLTGASCLRIPYSVFIDVPRGTMLFHFNVRDVNIVFLEDDTFLEIKTAVLSLKRNHISNMTGSSLTGLEHTLSSLDLSGNNLIRVPALTFNRIYNLRWLNLQDNYISSVSIFSWGSISSTLRTLFLGGNRIHQLAPDALLYFPRLTHLSLNDNLLRSSKVLSNYSFPANVTTINLSGNLQSAIPKSVFALPSIAFIYISDNFIQLLPTEAFSDRHLTIEELDLSKNFISNIPFNVFGRKLRIRNLNLNYNFLRMLPESAFVGLYPQKLSISHNLMADIDNNAFQGIGAYLFTLDLSFNRLEHIPKSVSHLNHLTELYLQGNKIKMISSDAFAPFVNKLTTLSLSNNRLDEFPGLSLNGASSLSHLDFDDNRISSLGGFHESWSASLGELRLASNRIGNLRKDVFRLTKNLHTLRLSMNSFEKLQSEHLAPSNRSLLRLEISHCLPSQPGKIAEIFKDLSALEILLMDGNDLSVISGSIFSKLPNLVHLDLQSNRMRSLPNTVFRSHVHTRLRFINLSFNMLSVINHGTFHRLLSLEHIVIFGNKIQNISSWSFNDLSKLRTIVLTMNIITNIHRDSFSLLPRLRKLALQHNRLTIFSLTIFGEKVGSSKRGFVVNASHNIISELSADGVYRLRGSNRIVSIFITLLDLSHNFITSLPANFFALLRNLSELVLSENRIVSLDVKVFAFQSNLMFLDLSKNKLFNVPIEALRSLTNVRVIRMSENMVDRLRHRFSPLRKLKVLDLSSNSIRIIHNVSLRRTNIERLVFNDNMLDSVPISCLRSISSTLNSLHLSGNKISAIRRNSFSDLPYLHTLDLSRNAISSISNKAFLKLKRLVTLNLSNNPLKKLTDETIPRIDTLHNLFLSNISISVVPKLKLHNVRVLDISGNRLSIIPAGSLENLWSLQELNLSHNLLTMVPCHLWPSVSSTLNSLDISHNPISTLIVSSFEGLTSLMDLDIRGLALKRCDNRVLLQVPAIRTLKVSSYPLSKTFRLQNLLNNVFSLRVLWFEITEKRLSHQLRWAFGPKLQQLVITGKDLSHISDNVFEGVENRHGFSIRITGTSVQELPVSILNHLKSMKSVRIDISRNKLKTLSKETFFKANDRQTASVLKDLDVSQNELQCGDCGLSWLRNYSQQLLWQQRRNEIFVNPSMRSNMDLVLQSLVSKATCIDKTKTTQLPLVINLPDEDSESCRSKSMANDLVAINVNFIVTFQLIFVLYFS